MGAHKGAYITDENGNVMTFEREGVEHLVAKYLKGTKADGGYFTDGEDARAKVKEIFHLDAIFDIHDSTDKAIGFIGAVMTDFTPTDGGGSVTGYTSPNAKYHNLTKRKGGMNMVKENVQVTSPSFSPNTRTGTATYTLLNDAGLNTLGDVGAVTTDYFFANALQVKANVKAPFYDNAEASVYALVPTSTGEYKVSDGTKVTVLKRNEGTAVASVLLNQSIGYSDTETGLSTIVTEIKTEEGTIKVEQYKRALTELKVLELVKCAGASTNPQTELEKEGAQTIRVAIFDKHHKMFVFPSSEGGVTESGVLFGSSSVPTKYNFPYFRPVLYNEEGLVALQAANGFVDNRLTDEYPAATIDTPDLESGYYADINNTAQGYWISQVNPGYIEKLWNPNWSAIKPVVSIYAFWQLTDSNRGIYKVMVQASVSAAQTSDVTITNAVIQLNASDGTQLNTFSVSGLTIPAGKTRSNVFTKASIQAAGLAAVSWGAIEVDPADTYTVIGETKNTLIMVT